MKFNGQQNLYITWGVLGIAAIGIGYVLIKWGLPAIAKAAADSASRAAGSLASGVGNTANSALNGLSTNQLTDGTDSSGNPLPASGFGGDYNYNYSGFGPASTLGAAANKVSGGLFADLGEGLGSLFSNQNGGSSTTYMVTFPDGGHHAVDSSQVDSNGRFTYGGVQYVLGDDGSGNKLATALTTVYGSGSGGGSIPYDFGVADPSQW